MKQYEYTVEYKVNGVFHDPCNPTYSISASNKQEARKKARKEITKLESERWGRKVTIRIIDVRPWVKPIPFKDFGDSIIMPMFKKDISKLKNYNYDIRSILMGGIS